ncbi:nicotianamine synthase, S-adenosyl-L-methionine-dependent methyltransferase [Tanacetum coccineum]
MLRSAHGARAFLYPVVDPNVLHGFNVLSIFHPDDDVINSVVISRKFVEPVNIDNNYYHDLDIGSSQMHQLQTEVQLLNNVAIIGVVLIFELHILEDSVVKYTLQIYRPSLGVKLCGLMQDISILDVDF